MSLDTKFDANRPSSCSDLDGGLEISPEHLVIGKLLYNFHAGVIKTWRALILITRARFIFQVTDTVDRVDLGVTQKTLKQSKPEAWH